MGLIRDNLAPNSLIRFLPFPKVANWTWPLFFLVLEEQIRLNWRVWRIFDSQAVKLLNMSTGRRANLSPHWPDNRSSEAGALVRCARNKTNCNVARMNN